MSRSAYGSTNAVCLHLLQIHDRAGLSAMDWARQKNYVTVCRQVRTLVEQLIKCWLAF